MKISVLGGTGYTGSNIVAEAAARGHEVSSFSRSVPDSKTAKVEYFSGSALDEAFLEQVVSGADAVVASLSPRGELVGKVYGIYQQLAELAAKSGVRLVVIGGFGSLRPEPGAERFAYGDTMPEELIPEARGMAQFLDFLLESAPSGLNWSYISPAATYGSFAPGEATGEYRVGADVAFYDAEGKSEISGVDFAKAIIDELEAPSDKGPHLSFAY